VLAVEDDGPGVPDELRALIFEPGFSRCGSTGLGLDIVAEVAAAHGGSVAFEPGAVGARFVLRLPAASAGVAVPLAHAAVSADAERTGGGS
jgi:signal transduction histidine kinase